MLSLGNIWLYLGLFFVVSLIYILYDADITVGNNILKR